MLTPEDDIEIQSRVQASLLEKQEQFLWKILDPSKTLDGISNMLRGNKLTESFDHDTGQYILKWVEDTNIPPLMTEEGINDMMAFLRWRLGPETTLSNIDDEEIGAIAENVAHDLNDKFLLNYKRYGISTENFRYIVNTIADMVFLSLKKAREGKFINMLRTTTQHIESHNIGQPREKRRMGWGQPKI